MHLLPCNYGRPSSLICIICVTFISLLVFMYCLIIYLVYWFNMETRRWTASMVRGMTTGSVAAEIREEGLLLDALAILAQPLAAVMDAISPDSCTAAGISRNRLKLKLDRAPYQLQLQLHQVSHRSVVHAVLTYMSVGMKLHMQTDQIRTCVKTCKSRSFIPCT